MAGGSAKWSGRDYELHEHTTRREQIVRSEDLSGDSHGAAEECQPAEQEDETAVRKDFWSLQGDFVYRHHIDPRVQLCVPTETTFRIPLKHMDVRRSTFSDLDIAQEKRIDDCWNVDGNKNLSDSRSGFTKFSVLKETPPKGYMWSGERLTKIQTTLHPDHVWPEAWTRIGKAAQRKENKMGTRKTKAQVIENARRKLETPMAPAMPCKRTIFQSLQSGNRCFKNSQSQCIWGKDKIQLYCRSTRIHET